MKVFLVIAVMLVTTHTTSCQYSDLKRSSIYDNYVDDHCEGHYQVETNTIIRTEDSIAGGGVFLNETSAASLARCLHYCCSYPLCNTAVYDARSDSPDGGSCYLFDCGSLENIKCQFTSNLQFSSAMLDIDRHKFDLTASDKSLGHSQQLSDLRDRVEECGQYQFRCRSGECVASYDTCNGIPQCEDGSDENPKLCPPPPSLPTVTSDLTWTHLPTSGLATSSTLGLSTTSLGLVSSIPSTTSSHPTSLPTSLPTLSLATRPWPRPSLLLPSTELRTGRHCQPL